MNYLISAAILGTVLVFGACGGDEDSPATPTVGAESGTTPSQPTTSGDNQPSESDNAGDRRAVVTVGDERYEFELSTQCLVMFGNLAGIGRSVDGRDIVINIGVPPEDWETSDEDWDPPSIRIDDRENDIDWRAGGEVATEMIPTGMSQVDDFTIDGSSASGTATFVDLYAAMRGEPEAVQGTFEFNCN